MVNGGETPMPDFKELIERLKVNEGNKPSFLSGKTVYTHSQILAILNDVDGEWMAEIIINQGE